MRICITSTGPNLDSQIDPRFGRCQYFLIVDKDGKLLEAIPNKGVQVMRGAGITAAQIVTNQGVNAVITGNVGPNAFMVLNQTGVKIYSGVFGLTAKQSLEKYNKGELKQIEVSTAPGRFGIGPGFGRGFGRGHGRGRR